MRIRTLTAIGALLLASATRAESFSDSVSVVEVQVPVQVTRGSEPVRGLTAEDFEVYDRGELQEIVSFNVVDLSIPAPAEAARETVSAPGAEGRNLLLLFDFAHSGNSMLTRALEGARTMVREQLHAADRVAVAYYTSSRGVSFIVGFTSDRDELALSLDLLGEILARDADGARTAKLRLDRVRGTDDDMGALASSFGWPAVLAMRGTALPTRPGRSGGGQGAFLSLDSRAAGGLAPYDERTQVPGGILSVIPSSPEELARAARRNAAVGSLSDFAAAMSDLVTLLRDVSGVRHVLLFSGGFGGIDPRSDDTTSKLYQFGKIRRSFLRSGWTLHTVSLKGVPDPFSTRGGSLMTAGNDSLFFLANETGGRLYENRNVFHEATEKFLESSSVTYLLTFIPSRLAENGHRHRIEVKLAGGAKGIRVKHRPAYYAPKPVKRRGELEQRLDAVDLLFGEEEVEAIAARPLAVPVRSSSPSSSPRPARVPVIVAIDGESLLEGDSSDRLTMEIQGYALDSAGGVTDFFVEEVDLSLAEARDRLAQDGVRFFGELALPPGAYRLRLLVVHEGDRRYFLKTVPIEIAGTSAEPALLPPFFVDSDRAPLTVTEEEVGAGHLFDFEGESLYPAIDPEVGPGESWPIWVAGYQLDGTEAIDARVVAEDGTVVDGGRFVLDRRLPDHEGGLARFLGTFEATGLLPGRYRLELRGPAGAPVSSDFRVARF